MWDETNKHTHKQTNSRESVGQRTTGRIKRFPEAIRGKIDSFPECFLGKSPALKKRLSHYCQTECLLNTTNLGQEDSPVICFSVFKKQAPAKTSSLNFQRKDFFFFF